ncbi:phasin family protein [Zavarzinia sp.]|uniref:phasin family protein n=1 Tax=Zavarzinia sp. TaxID=2027920 RepID=UPI0035638237
MVKKLVVKKLKSVGTDSQLSATIRESAQQIWLAGLGAFAKAQREGNKVFDALVRQGESIQKSTRKVAEDKVTEMAAKATGTWDKLEQVFENRVARSLHSLGVPTRDDVAALSKRVAELKAEVEKLNKAAGKPAPKAAARKPAAKPKAAAPKAKVAAAKPVRKAAS